MRTAQQQTIRISPPRLFGPFVVRPVLLVCLLCVFLGCTSSRFTVEKNLMENKVTPAQAGEILACYRVGCTDLLAVTVRDRPDLSFRDRIGPDGRMNVPRVGPTRLEDMTVRQVHEYLADRLNQPPEAVSVQVLEFNSQQIYLFGEVLGAQQSLPYHGPETVLNLLQRIGGITPAAQPEEVFVVRSNIAKATRPEVFRVDLNAIVLKNDQSTNIRLEPYDRIYVGETRQARVERCIPPWLRPVYQAIWDTHPSGWHPKSKLRQRINNARHDGE